MLTCVDLKVNLKVNLTPAHIMPTFLPTALQNCDLTAGSINTRACKNFVTWPPSAQSRQQGLMVTVVCCSLNPAHFVLGRLLSVSVDCLQGAATRLSSFRS